MHPVILAKSGHWVKCDRGGASEKGIERQRCSNQMTPRVVIVGASGVIGSAATEHFVRRGWDVVAVSRREPDVTLVGRCRHVALDLFDRVSCARELGALEGVSRVVYTALSTPRPSLEYAINNDEIQENIELLRNSLTPLITTTLEHVCLLQGTKAYGSKYHDISIPAKESEPRDPNPNFYWDQEDLLHDMAQRKGFTYTILRPQHVVGGAIGTAMNMVPVVGVYASVRRHLGQRCGFPGGAPFIWEATDARILAGAMEWAFLNEGREPATYNVTNGDVFTWRGVWPDLMDALGTTPGPDEACSVFEFLIAHADVWDEIAKEFGLKERSLEALLGGSLYYADRSFAYGTAAARTRLVSTIRLRQAGYTSCIDTTESFRYWIGKLQADGILPPR